MMVVMIEEFGKIAPLISVGYTESYVFVRVRGNNLGVGLVEERFR